MNIKIFIIISIFSFFVLAKQYTYQLFNNENQYVVDYVNPLMGTDSTFELSNGNTYPAIATPWGMNFWTPMTAKMGDGWTYKYDDNKIRG